MKETTPTKIMTGSSGAIYDYVCTHKPVKIISAVRPDIVMLLADDYEEMKLKIEELESDKILP